MFIGREKEKEQLARQFSRTGKTAVLVYGKRRVGKSTLIREAARSFDGIFIDHLCVATTYEGNIELLCRSVAQAFSVPEMRYSRIEDVFDFLKAQKKRVVLLIDEYQYLKESLRGDEADSRLQSIIDRLDGMVKVVLCGSYIAVMRELLERSNPLFGRFTCVMRVEEFDYLDAARFYPDVDLATKIAYYAVFGGSPYVVSCLDPSAGVRDNILSLTLNQNDILRVHVEGIMLKEVQKSFDIRILEMIGNGKKRYSDIASSLRMGTAGLLDKQLKSLVGMEILSKVHPINAGEDRRKTFYCINDNLMRFYFAFIFGNSSLVSRLGERAFYRANIEKGLKTFVSLRFEEIVLQYFARLSRNGEADDIVDFGSYWYDDRKNKRNGQFDCVVKRDSAYDFYEVKNFSRPMKLSECRSEAEQIRAVSGINPGRIGFVCTAGFDFESDEYDLITAEELYFAKRDEKERGEYGERS